MMFAIKVEGLSKEYEIGARKASGGLLVDQLADVLHHPLRTLRQLFARDKVERFWALSDLDFEIEQGTVMGVIGRNGAGKSTLLKILSRITEPSRGRALVRGRIASLLEVGTGFHPELSGRENVFLNATILGMRRREIERKFDEIVAFSGVERFLDTPVKHYSSGMYVRLAFAVAAHVEADILLVDEVLAVGDAEFQKRCLARMSEVAQSGETVLFVSHALDSIRRLCGHSIWIDAGGLKAIGDTESVLQGYASGNISQKAEWIPLDIEFGSVELIELQIVGTPGEDGNLLPSHDIIVSLEYRVCQRVQGRLAIAVQDELGQTVFSSASTDGGRLLNDTFLAGRFRSTCRVPPHLLIPGSYSLSLAVPDMLPAGDHRIFSDVASFRVSNLDSLVSRDARRGAVAPLLDWETLSLRSDYID